MTPLVSAVIPCFNYGRFVRRAVESVLAQTCPLIECIVVDDGSTDETADVLREFGPRIRVIHQEHRGVSAARNAALAVARGEFIGFLDGDDWWHPAKIERQLERMTSRAALGCVGCGLEHVYPDGRVERIAGRTNRRSRRDAHRLVAMRRFWVGGSGSGGFVRRSLIERLGRFDERLVAAEDWDMWLRIAAEAEIDNVEGVLVSINRHGTGVFRDSALMERNQWKVYDSIVTRWPGLLSWSDRRRVRAMILGDAAGECRSRRDALAYYGRSLKEWPFNSRRTRSAAVLAVRSVQAALRGREASPGA